MIHASAPGKLYIAGEYAVIEPGHPAIIVALDQFITVHLKESKHQGSIRSGQYGGLSIPWTRKNGQLLIDQRENPFAYITEAVLITEEYVKELGIPLRFFDLEVESELDNTDGKKYGLGSSGAVTVATIKALLLFYKIPFTSTILYKLAALAHLSIKSNGSFGDLAASTFGGWIAYSCFDKKWLSEEFEKVSLPVLLKEDWPQLRIQPLLPPEDLNLFIGWTGTPASTTQLVDLMKAEKNDMRDFYHQFLAQSKTCVEGIISAFGKRDLKEIEKGIRKNRLLLQQLAQKSGVQIETSLLNKLCEIAESFGGTAKSSGAGGGDCGIVIMHQNCQTQPMIHSWEKIGIRNLPLHVFSKL